MFRLIATILAFVFLSQLTYAEVDSGRYEISELGQAYWLPAWLSKNIFYDFKNRLIEVKTKQAEKIKNLNPNQCASAYQRLYKKSDIRWSIFFGYGDGDGKNHTTDFAERDVVEKEIRSTCPEDNPEIQFCGFTAEGNAGEYVRQVLTKQNRLINIHIRLFNASVTSEIEKNMADSSQKRKSIYLEKAYIDALKTDDIVFYAGHARYGSGPGFRPLVRKTKDWWVAALFRPMIYDVVSALNPGINNSSKEYPESVAVNPGTNPSVIGMFSCEAEAHYGLGLANNSESGLILTRQSVDYADNLRLLYASANALLKQECEEEFSLSMRSAITKIYYRKDNQPPQDYEKQMPKLFNFFHQDKVKNKNDILLYFQTKDEKVLDITNQNQAQVPN